jgi:hypothetical protein
LLVFAWLTLAPAVTHGLVLHSSGKLLYCLAVKGFFIVNQLQLLVGTLERFLEALDVNRCKQKKQEL